MSLPISSHPIWVDIISGKKQIQFEFLAIKIFLGGAQVRFKQNPALSADIAKELHKLFEQNINLPSVKKDIEKLK